MINTKKLLLGGGIVAIIAALFLALSTHSFAGSSAYAQDEADLSATVNISVKATGESNGASATLEKTAYNTGETVVLNWKGGKDGDDFVIPSTISFNGKTYNIAQLVPIETLQSPNTEYKRRMGSDGTMMTFASLQNYLAKSHSLSLGRASLGGTVSVTFTKVAPVYRLYNMLTSEHLFTTQKAEYDKFVELCKTDSDAWIGEGISWLAPKEGSGTSQVYRLYNEGLGAMGHSSHYYTSDVSEKNNLESQHGWKDDGTINGFMSGGSTAIYTCYNEGLGSAHHYTSSKTEWQGLKQHGWALEEDKNGTNPVKTPEGCFQCSLATSWSFDGNYYTVRHLLNGQVMETEYKSGKAGDDTVAKAKDFPGYKQTGSIANKKIASNNSTVVDVNYAKSQYTITYNMNGYGKAISAKTANYGDKITKPTDPTDANATFGGWYYDANCTSGKEVKWTTMPATNMTIYAKWTAKPGTSVTVKFNLGSNAHGATAIPDQTIVVPGKATRPANPTSTDGYTFDDWYKDEGLTTKFDFNSDITGNTTIYAKWNAPSPTPVEKVTITFNSDGGSTTPDPQTIDKGGSLTTIPTVTKENYIFDGWYDGETKVTAETKFNESKTLKAHWSETVKITFNTNTNGTIANTEATIKKGGTLTADQLKTPGEFTNYDFDAWYYEAGTTEHLITTKVTESTVFNADTTLTARWTVKEGVETVTINLVLGNQLAQNIGGDEIKVAKGSVAPEPVDPYVSSESGYAFRGWYDSETRKQDDTKHDWSKPVYDNDGKEDGVINVYAGWAKWLTIKFEKNQQAGMIVEGEMKDQERQLIGVGYKLEANTYKAYNTEKTKQYGFKGWTYEYDGKTYECADRYDGYFDTVTPGRTLTLKANWTTTELGDYWLSQGSWTIKDSQAQINGDYYNFPESGVVKTQTDVENDLNTIASITDKSSPTYISLVTEYTNYMINDQIHLYTKYAGKTLTDVAVNDYAEFRIIHVGPHTANSDQSDNSILTFQMTHALPKGYALNATLPQKAGGYVDSELRTQMASGDIYSLFDESFKQHVQSVKKYTREGFTYSTPVAVSDTIKVSDDKFWLISYRELASGVQDAFTGHSYDLEGAQYTFYANKGFTVGKHEAESTLPALTKLAYTRSGGVPDGIQSLDKGGWWTRSQYPNTSATYAGFTVSNGTLFNAFYSQGLKQSVVPCFCVNADSANSKG